MAKQEIDDMRQMTPMGRRIESGSFGVIDDEIGSHDFDEQEYEIVRRVIHSTADFEFKHLVKFGNHAIEAGIEALRGGLEKDPRSDLLHYYLGKAYERKGRPEDAIEYYERAIETNPEFEDALVCLATLYEKAGMRHKSVEIWQRVLSTTPDAAPRERIKAHIMELL